MAAVSRSVAEVLTGPERGFRVLTAWPAVIHLLLDPLTALTRPSPSSPPAECDVSPAECDVAAGSRAQDPAGTSHSAGPQGTGGPGAGGGAKPEVLALLGDGAVRLPLGLLLAPDERRLLAAARVGDRGAVGAGRLELAGMTVRPTRWWDPSLPRPGVVAAGRGEVLTAALPELPEDVTLPAARLAEALTGRDPGALREAVTRLLGLGPGLTPAGDDVLVGALAARPAGLAEAVDAVLAEAPGRTTALSAALLDQALRGYGLPELAALLGALDGTADAAVPPAAARLAAVGGSSGAAIGHGLVLGLQAVAVDAGRAA